MRRGRTAGCLWLLLLAGCGGRPEADTGLVVTVEVDDSLRDRVGRLVVDGDGVSPIPDLSLRDLPTHIGVVPYHHDPDLRGLDVHALSAGSPGPGGSQINLATQRLVGPFDEGAVRWVRVRLWDDGCTDGAQNACRQAGGRICCGGLCELPKSFSMFPEWPGEGREPFPEEALWCPPPTPSAEDFVVLDGGYGAYCGIQRNGRVRCWGDISWPGDSSGVGSGRARLVPLPDGEKARLLAVGFGFACAVTEGPAGQQHVRCWGKNTAGQLGVAPPPDGGAQQREVALPDGVGRIEEIDAGFAFVCTRSASGRVDCWGDNSRGQLGTEPAGGYPPGDVGTHPVPEPTPRRLPLPAGFVVRALALGGWHGCLLADEGPRTGQVLCWGSRQVGQLGDGPRGDGDPPARAEPRPVPGLDGAATLSSVSSLASRFATSCALADTTSGPWVVCWGVWPQSVTNPVRFFPQRVTGPFDPGPAPGGAGGELVLGSVAAAGGSDLAVTLCMRTARGAVGCLGSGQRGQLGPLGPSGGFVDTAWQQLFWGAVDQVALAGMSTCVLQAWGRVACWGDERVGQLARGQLSDQPRQLPAPIVLDGAP